MYGQDSKFGQFWGLYSHIAAPIDVKFGTGTVHSPVPNCTFIGTTCRPCLAKTPFLDHGVKIIPAWLRYAQACR